MKPEELRNPRLFERAIPRLLAIARLQRGQERELWGWRAHALRRGEKPAALFMYMVRNTGKAREITGEDEREAGLAMQQARYERVAQGIPDVEVPHGVDRKFYLRHLRSPIWKWIRKMKLRAAKYTCSQCGRRQSRRDLHVHHVTYARLGRERLADLEVLCWQCHELEHPSKPGFRGMGWNSVGSIVDSFWRDVDSGQRGEGGPR